MSAVAPGWKLRVLLAQALFANPDIMLLDEPTNNLDIDTIRWLEGVLNERKCTMIIISHDRHFLNTVCTHMADLDYRELRVFPGNYDEYMIAATQARERLFSENAKKKAQIADLQAFVSRFSANASKSRQATSRAAADRENRARGSEALEPHEPVHPLRAGQEALSARRRASRSSARAMATARCSATSTLTIEAGERVAVVGTNGIGKTTLLRSIMGEIPVNHGTVKWAENAEVAYMPQDNAAAFEDPVTVFDWMRARGKPRDDDQAIRATLGRMLFSRDEMAKTVDKLSGGERGRMLFGEIMLQAAEHHPHGRADEPSRHGVDRGAEPGARELPRHADLREPRPRVRVVARDARSSRSSPRASSTSRGSYDDYLRSRGIAIDLQRAASQ